MTELDIPQATYRLQFNKSWGFSEAQTLIPYLHNLGVSHLYASPLLQSRQGSSHGYDVTDPTRLNEELGDTEGFMKLAATLQQHSMGLLLDIVPNHMAASPENPWWQGVLREGAASPYAAFFDIDWQYTRPALQNKVLLPILGVPFDQALENQELQVKLDQDGFHLHYHRHRLPLHARSCRRLLSYRLETLLNSLGSDHLAILQLRDLLESFNLPPSSEGEAPELTKARKSLWHLYRAYPQVQAFVDENLRIFNGVKGEPRSFNLLEQLLADQSYRLTYWRVANQDINYRRFFDVNDLVATRVDQEEVFEALHARVCQLTREGKLNGLRIDHIDGLRDPEGYLERLRNSLPGSSFYVVVEKILCGSEELPGHWPVYGTTGYEFLNLLNGLFVDPEGIHKLDNLYHLLAGSYRDFPELVYTQKKKVMAELFASEMRALTNQLGRLAEVDRQGHDLTLEDLAGVLAEVTACLPVYRTYTRNWSIAERDRNYLESALQEVERRRPTQSLALAFLRRVLLLDLPHQTHQEIKDVWLKFVLDWQQFSGPIMAKGFEDTSLYLYHRLLSLNEVGGDPGRPGVGVVDFHRSNQQKLERWPHSLNTTSTHDTKRGEDLRCRLNVLSELPGEWSRRLELWQNLNRPCKPLLQGEPVPGANEEYLIYQTLLGAWPWGGEAQQDFPERFLAYLIKAAREAKSHTSWLQPNSAYEEALRDFARALLQPGPENRFLADFLPFQRTVAYFGALGSLAQVLLKITAPGVPDFYQGCEFWNLSLVDPDNRRPVDFVTRSHQLAILQQQEASGLLPLVGELLASWPDGRIKLYLIYKALHVRRSRAALFAGGAYQPLPATGPRQEHVCAFARHQGKNWALVAVPRLLARLRKGAGQELNLKGEELPPLSAGDWDGDQLLLPPGSPARWHNVFTGEEIDATAASPGAPRGQALPLSALWSNFPAALLQGL